MREAQIDIYFNFGVFVIFSLGPTLISKKSFIKGQPRYTRCILKDSQQN
jgi:hypothetical protein